MMYQRVCSCNNILGASVILFKLENTGMREVCFEVKDIVYICPSESINTLGIVSHCIQVLLVPTKLQQDLHLCNISILELINKDVIIFLLIVFSNSRMVIEHLIRVEKQVIKIHGICFQQSFLVFFVNIS